jgi:hypothetical protein
MQPDDLFPYAGLSAECASRKAVELVERCAAGRMGWMALAGELRKLEYVARTAPPPARGDVIDRGRVE